MSKTYKRGDRMHRDNIKRKDRICEVIRTWGGLDYWKDNDYDWMPKLRRRIEVSAKTRHPYSGDTRKVREEYKPDYPGGYIRNAKYDDVNE